jgi:hypothetical protein
MDSFESVIAAVLERRGYWTRTCVKVELTKPEKKAIGRHSSPRWELDVVGYSGNRNELIVLECKSLLNSRGVQARTFLGTNAKDEKRYKLFFEDKTREVVLERLTRQLVEAEFCQENPRIKLGLAAGKIDGDPAVLTKRFQDRGWELWTPEMIRDDLRKLANSKYENSVASVVAKILQRGAIEPEPGVSKSTQTKSVNKRASTTKSV